MAEATPIGTANDERDNRNQNRSDKKWNNAIPILPETGGDPFAAKQK